MRQGQSTLTRKDAQMPNPHQVELDTGITRTEELTRGRRVLNRNTALDASDRSRARDGFGFSTYSPGLSWTEGVLGRNFGAFRDALETKPAKWIRSMRYVGGHLASVLKSSCVCVILLESHFKGRNSESMFHPPARAYLSSARTDSGSRLSQANNSGSSPIARLSQIHSQQPIASSPHPFFRAD